METCISQTFFHALRDFLSYLWGMETPVDKKYPQDDFYFLSYLWGMETFQTFCKLVSSIPFLSYLWGMETETANVLKNGIITFYPTY